MNSVKTVFLMTLLAVIMMALGSVFGGRQGVIIMLILSLGMNFFAYWFSDSIVLKMYNAQEADPSSRLYGIVADLAQRADLPMPKVYVLPTQVPNAFATGRNPSHSAVAATAGILEMLDDEEIRGVLAHEMSHIMHRDILISTIVACFASVISMIANMAQWAAIFGRGGDDDEGQNPLVLIATMIIAPIAAAIIQMAISRAREYMADDEGGRMIDDPLALARALAKIDNYAHYRVMDGATNSTAHMFIINPLSGLSGGLQTLFSTHPSTESRIQKLQELDRKLHGR
jgi:heat shock protein HtpX